MTFRAQVTDRLRTWLYPARRMAAPRTAQEIGYDSGGEFDPGDPFGLCLMTLRSDGAAELVNRHRGQERRYRAALAPHVFEALLGHLRDAGFPEVLAHVIPAGPTRRLRLSSATARLQTPPMAFHEAGDWPGYREAFRLLDSLIVAVSQGEVRVLPDPMRDLLADPGGSSPGRS